MRLNTLKAMAAITVGAACCSTVLYAATGPVKSQTTTEAATPSVRDSMGSAGKGAQNPVALNDAQILGVVVAVDENEVAAAGKAEKMKMGSEAMAYAKMLREEHKADADKTKKLGKEIGAKPASSALAIQLKDNGKSELKAMSSKKGADFEKAYVDAMVNGHADVLKLIDETLIPDAQNEAVKKHLAEVRGHVAMHLEQGKRLQGAQASKTE